MITNYFSPILLSLQVAGWASIFAIILGVGAGYWMRKSTFPGKFFVELLFLLPIVLPPTVVGFILLIILGSNSFLSAFIFTKEAAIIAATVVAFPMMFQGAKAGFSHIDADIEDAARVDGANEWRVFRHITIPLALPTLLSGAILSIARALGEFGATLMIAGNIPGRTQTLPIAIYTAMNTNNQKLAWVYVTIILLISIVFLFLIQIISKKNYYS